MSVKGWAIRQVLQGVLAGAKTTTPEHAEARKAICKKCPHVGTVEPIYKMSMIGCTLCGCPLDTKAHFAELPRLRKNAGEPLSFEELIEFTKRNKDADIIFEKVICPDKENRWAAIDSLHFNNLVT